MGAELLVSEEVPLVLFLAEGCCFFLDLALSYVSSFLLLLDLDLDASSEDADASLSSSRWGKIFLRCLGVPSAFAMVVIDSMAVLRDLLLLPILCDDRAFAWSLLDEICGIVVAKDPLPSKYGVHINQE